MAEDAGNHTMIGDKAGLITRGLFVPVGRADEFEFVVDGTLDAADGGANSVNKIIYLEHDLRDAGIALDKGRKTWGQIED